MKLGLELLRLINFNYLSILEKQDKPSLSM